MKERIAITSLSSTGEGVGCCVPEDNATCSSTKCETLETKPGDRQNGLKVFVDGVLPGEIIEAELTLQKKNYAKAKTLRILQASPHRVEPPCPLFGTCGGCQLMHLNYEEQLNLKEQRVKDALVRIGHFEDQVVEKCLPSPLPLGYRNKIQLPLSFEDGIRKMGLFKKESHEIIPLEKCYIQCDQGEEVLRAISPLLQLPSIRYVCIKNAVSTKESLVILVTDGKEPKEILALSKKILKASPLIKGVIENVNRRDDSVIFSHHFRSLAGASFIHEKINGKIFRISASSFFQVNTNQASALFEYAKKTASLSETKTVLDAFCGVGTLSLFAADTAASVTGIEIVPQAIRDAEENAKLNQNANCTFLVGQAEKIIPNLPSFDVVFLNPPRKGCDPELLSTLINHTKAETLIYISCDPATLARDLASFKKGGYKIGKIQPFDMFPQTMHVETVAHIYK